MKEYLCYAELAVGISGLVFGIWSEWKRKSERESVHAALVNLKPLIRGENRADVIAAINNTLEFLKAPKPTNRFSVKKFAKPAQSPQSAY
jgi:hypothetical protein